MDVVGPANFLTNLIGRIADFWFNRPRLGIKIILFRPDTVQKRLIFRASVLNYGRVIASNCEGFWTIFSPDLHEISSGGSVFWCPPHDEDYNFENRVLTSVDIEYNEKRFCWAELYITEAPVNGTNIHLFPYDYPAGRYIFALVIEYGMFRSFDFLGVDIPGRILSPMSVNDAIEKLEIYWNHRRGLKGILRSRQLKSFISKTDYHNYVRPT